MHVSKLGGIVSACALLALPAAGLAASTTTSHNGEFAGTAHYKVAGKAETAKLTITVARHKIGSLDLVASVLPLDAQHSHGNGCGSFQEITTAGYTRSGTMSNSGQFKYSFASAGNSDRVSVTGRFTDAKHAKGTFRDVAQFNVSNSHCDTGTVNFTVSRG